MFLAAWAVFFVVLNLGTVVAWWVSQSGFTAPDLDLFLAMSSEPVPGWLIAGSSVVQFAGMLCLTLFGAWLVARVRRARLLDTDGIPNTLTAQLANRPAAAIGWLAALGGGLTIGWFPAWLSAQIKAWFPMLDLGAVASVGSILHDGDVASRLTLILIITIAAPICEELLFRGWLWSALERWMSPMGVILTTSVLFAAFHLDPSQAIPLIVTGCFFGWLRYTTNAIGPAIAAHMTNNTLAVYLMLQPSPPAIDSAFLVTSIIVTIAMAMGVYRAVLDRHLIQLPKSVY
jgi:membrane protease YdiL (CAAX protease family)